MEVIVDKAGFHLLEIFEFYCAYGDPNSTSKLKIN